MPQLKTLFALCLLGLAVITNAKDRVETKAVLSSTGQVNLGLAQSYFQNNDMETALDRANQALHSDPKSGDVHAMLGLIYSHISQNDKAAAELKRAVELSPDDGSILNIDGAWLCQQGKPAEAEAQFLKALQDPFYKQQEQALFNAGKCAYQSGQLEKAEGYFRMSLEKSPDQAEVLLSLAQVEFAKGNFMDARAFVQRRDALGSSPEVLDLAAHIEDAAGDHDAAERYRKRLQNEFPASNLPTGEGANGHEH